MEFTRTEQMLLATAVLDFIGKEHVEEYIEESILLKLSLKLIDTSNNITRNQGQEALKSLVDKVLISYISEVDYELPTQPEVSD